jgi:hypothetical protein
VAGAFDQFALVWRLHCADFMNLRVSLRATAFCILVGACSAHSTRTVAHDVNAPPLPQFAPIAPTLASVVRFPLDPTSPVADWRRQPAQPATLTVSPTGVVFGGVTLGENSYVFRTNRDGTIHWVSRLPFLDTTGILHPFLLHDGGVLVRYSSSVTAPDKGIQMPRVAKLSPDGQLAWDVAIAKTLEGCSEPPFEEANGDLLLPASGRPPITIADGTVISTGYITGFFVRLDGATGQVKRSILPINGTSFYYATPTRLPDGELFSLIHSDHPLRVGMKAFPAHSAIAMTVRDNDTVGTTRSTCGASSYQFTHFGIAIACEDVLGSAAYNKIEFVRPPTFERTALVDPAADLDVLAGDVSLVDSPTTSLAYVLVIVHKTGTIYVRSVDEHGRIIQLATLSSGRNHRFLSRGLAARRLAEGTFAITGMFADLTPTTAAAQPFVAYVAPGQHVNVSATTIDGPVIVLPNPAAPGLDNALRWELISEFDKRWTQAFVTRVTSECGIDLHHVAPATALGTHERQAVIHSNGRGVVTQIELFLVQENVFPLKLHPDSLVVSPCMLDVAKQIPFRYITAGYPLMSSNISMPHGW